CESTSIWRPQIIFDLWDANGGIGNVRGNLLDFLYQAITSGSAIVVPGFAHRSDSDLAAVFSGKDEFQHFFDLEFFLESIQDACPKMSLHLTKNGLHEIEEPFVALSMRTDLDGNASPQIWRTRFDDWYEKNLRSPGETN